MEKDFGLRIQHCALNVRDLDESIAWYTDILGFELVKRFNNVNLGRILPDCAQMRNGDFYLELYETPTAEPYSYVDLEYSIGVKHFSLSVADMDSFMEFIRSRKDVEIATDNEYSEELCGEPGGDKVAYIKDCNGILIELQKVHNWR